MHAHVYVSPDDRIAGLLDANNRYLARARAAEAKVRSMIVSLDRIADAARQDPAEETLQVILELAADTVADVSADSRWTGILPALMGLAEIVDEHFEEGEITDEGKPLVVAALARVFPDRVQTRETCSCGGKCDECPTAADMLGLDRKLSAHFADMAARGEVA